MSFSPAFFISLDNEMDLIAKILNGDTQLFCELVHRYEQRVYRVALRVLPNPADAEEIVQETFISAYRNLHRFRGDAKFNTWLTAITLNHARGRLRSRRSHIVFSIDGGDEYEVSEPMQIVAKELSPLELAERAEIRTVLLESLNVLAPGYRAVVLLRDLEGLSTANTAKSLGISIAATKARLYRARRLLRKELQMLLSLDPIRMISVKPQARRDCNSCLQEKGRDQSSPHVSSRASSL